MNKLLFKHFNKKVSDKKMTRPFDVILTSFQAKIKMFGKYPLYVLELINLKTYSQPLLICTYKTFYNKYIDQHAMYYLIHEECFIIFKTRGAAERFRYDKTRLFECIK